jgi:8-hydroxy-5-deazaflavin:NADPH oxidoreductase
MQLADLKGRISSEIVAELAPGARVVKALNSIYMSRFSEGPKVGKGRRVLFVSGDDGVAKRAVAGLLKEFGFSTIDLGSLHEGGRAQQVGNDLAGPDPVEIIP